MSSAEETGYEPEPLSLPNTWSPFKLNNGQLNRRKNSNHDLGGKSSNSSSRANLSTADLLTAEEKEAVVADFVRQVYVKLNHCFIAKLLTSSVFPVSGGKSLRLARRLPDVQAPGDEF